MNTFARWACVLAMMGAAACDDSFTPLVPTDLQLSVFGYLNASADTQWIRVSPIRSTILTSPDPPGATVTLENLGTGQIIEMRDSIFYFSGNSQTLPDGAYFHNFWTTERIEPGATYRFSAKVAGEKPAEAVVAMPPDYGVELWISQFPPRSDILRLAGLRYVAFVESITDYYDDCGTVVQRTVFGTGSPETDVQMIPISRSFSSRVGCGTTGVDGQELSIVGSGAKWPTGRDYSAGRLSVPDSLSNVSNSVGFLGGVLTRQILYDNCRIVGGDRSDYCKLHYDATVATLRGTVTDTLCTGEGIKNIPVELTELDPVPPAKPKVRFMNTGHSGQYVIGALEPGQRYALLVHHYDVNDPLDRYFDHTDTLEFAPGENRSYDVELRRITCPPK